MSEHVLTEKPAAFLARHAENPNVLLTFEDPDQVDVIEVTNGDFVRGAGGGNNPAGKWWIRSDALDAILAHVRTLPQRPNERRNLLQREIRNRTAVSVNWNALSAFWGMQLRGQSIVGLRGRTKAQPVWDPAAGGSAPATLGSATQRTLPGGVVQYFFPVVRGDLVRYYGAASGRSF